MPQQLHSVALLVRDYDEALAFYVDRLGFTLITDTPLSDSKRWVEVAPSTDPHCARLVLAQAADEHQATRVGDQTGGRVFLFLRTDDFWGDHRRFRANGVRFIREPKVEPYGTVAVFEDLYGNLWDLIG